MWGTCRPIGTIERRAGDRVGHHAALQAEHGPDCLLGDDLVRGAHGVDPALAHGDDVVGVPGGEPEVVQDHDQRRAALPVQVAQQVQDGHLVGEVEVGRGLVEEQQVGALREREGEPDPLPLAAGQLVDDPAGQVGGAGQRQRLRHGRLVLGAPPPQRALVRVPAAGDEVGDGDPVGHDRRLRQQADGARDLPGGQAVHGLAVQQRGAAGRAEQPAHALEQRRLAAGVRADDRGDATVRDRQVDGVDDGALAVPQGEAVGRQTGLGSGGAHRVLRLSCQSRKGAPRAPVTTPTG